LGKTEELVLTACEAGRVPALVLRAAAFGFFVHGALGMLRTRAPALAAYRLPIAVGVGVFTYRSGRESSAARHTCHALALGWAGPGGAAARRAYEAAYPDSPILTVAEELASVRRRAGGVAADRDGTLRPVAESDDSLVDPVTIFARRARAAATGPAAAAAAGARAARADGSEAHEGEGEGEGDSDGDGDGEGEGLGEGEGANERGHGLGVGRELRAARGSERDTRDRDDDADAADSFALARRRAKGEARAQRREHADSAAAAAPLSSASAAAATTWRDSNEDGEASAPRGHPRDEFDADEYFGKPKQAARRPPAEDAYPFLGDSAPAARRGDERDTRARDSGR
jgi:hypothetical protein